jgi:hypothetical protein
MKEVISDRAGAAVGGRVLAQILQLLVDAL